MKKIKQLDMELAGGCNYACQMCPQSFGREKEFKQILKWDNFVKIVDDAIEHEVESISIHGGGEPTLSKHFIKTIKYIKSKNVKCFAFSNGYILDDNMIQEIADSGLDMFRISCIGYDSESYNKWMPTKVKKDKSDRFLKVRDNVSKLVDICKDTNTEIHANHLIIDINQKDYEVEQYIKNWVNITNTKSEIWMMHNWSGEYTEVYPRRKDKRRTCGRPMAPMLQVRAGGLDKHQGAVVACCMVLGNDKEATLGHLDTNTIQEVLDGDKYQELIRAHKEERFDDIPYCKNCDQLWDVPESLVWTNIEDREYNQSHIVGDLKLA
tara:strand:- start:567 stop:1535 length:969 start_codon:yes stop_codon:yes gene_type:complete